ncbi:2-oxo-4-hydroxy-4-carboxy-5-ureidoimidazoline decarboxylase [Actinocrispum wychmicini]|uniref:2-oxo-4-hydroxy-4-carboxy-5-ureidoimidazoline decarboxylase n=1 Tax=Actinocrispum wychmicini TaxID=1213861 RepID=A0A4R2JBU8_9PSEU|nr:2-oxo-4-hydroxy-4-carboxy-5-ureidoimidazoline decarboxylase [Actinocrispum wychmicini]TCO56973.1 2-oxo-4-hydroxy-4-carboxy-5-ureidoimidazoline decarboxylase [Actinocrispum wychmicini]
MHAVNLNRFNSAPADDLRPLLADCLSVPRWVDTVLTERPYASREAFIESAGALAADLTADEIHAAMAGHPRIGERRTGDRFSSAEQSGVDASLADRLRTANERYEQRFGHIYLVFASGRSGEELLAILQSRLDNDPSAELRVVNAELAKITILRLRKLVTDE